VSTALLRTRRFLPLFLTQALGALNDNLFKNALVVLVVFRVAESLRASHNCGTKCHVPSLEEGVETAETPGDGFRAGWLVAA